ASIRNKAASASRTAASVCVRIRPGRLYGSSFSKPAVSITRNLRSNSRASPSRRSRVTPGLSSTSATRLPTSRLNRVDLPTLGRPMMATVGRGMARAPCPPTPLRSTLAESGQASAIVEDVERRAGDHRLQADAGADIALSLESAIVRIDVDERAARRNQDQAVAGQHRTRIENRPLFAFLIFPARQLVDPAD